MSTPVTYVKVRFTGGPWHGQDATVPSATGPVFKPGDTIGNYYWLDTESDPPTYHWSPTSSSPSS